jgi:CDP-4-dehydro-6-deoxyglucose reductase, E3
LSADEHQVRIEPHGRTIRVAAGRAVLEAALSAGLNLPHSCKSGHCGSCRARLLAGEIAYPNGLPLGITAQQAQGGEILLCQARARSDLRVEARLIAGIDDVEIKTLPCRIARLTPLAPDVMQVLLRLPAVERLRFHPGQYLDVLLDGGRRRSFSIASPPHDSELLELHVRRVSGGGFTERLFGHAPGDAASATPGVTPPAPSSPLGAGALLRIEGPVGQFSYRDSAGPVLMVAGGTGFAPLKSMLRHVLETGIRRDIHFYWGARHVRDLYEEQLVLEWVRRHPQLAFTAVLSEATAREAVHQRVGWVHEAVLADYPDLERFEVYAAGPPAMIEAMRASFPSRGLPTERLYFDSFDYAPDAAQAILGPA